MLRTIKFRGLDRRGTARSGQQNVEEVAAFVEGRYVAGWRELTVISLEGEQLGAIVPLPGRRTWWGEN